MENAKENEKSFKTLEEGEIIKEEPNGDWTISRKKGDLIKRIKKGDWVTVIRFDMSGEVDHHCLSDHTKSYTWGMINGMEYHKRMFLL